MNLFPVQESQWFPLQKSAYGIDEIKTKAKRIIDGLRTVTKDAEERGDPKMSFSPSPDSDGIWDVETDLGRGRLSLQWRSDDKELFGVLVFERALSDQLDRRIWEAALAIKVPAQGAWRVGITDATADTTRHLNEGNKLYELALSILYLVINGPSVR